MTISIISKTNEYIYIAIVYRWMDKKLFIEKMRKSMEIFNRTRMTTSIKVKH